MIYRKRLTGFTLIEIIVSLAIIGVLLSISIVSYGNWKHRSTVVQAKNDLLQLATAFEDYRSSSKQFPTDVSALSNFKSSNGIAITGGSLNGFYYCINAASVADGSLIYHITSDSKEVLSGACPASSWKSVSLGRRHTCAIDSNDRAYCWGQNDSGQLGDQTTNASTVPVPVSQGSMPSLNVKQIVAGMFHSCAIASDDQVYCWGSDAFNGLGNGSGGNIDSNVPKSIAQGALTTMRVKQISGNINEVCVVAFDDIVYCWGNGVVGIPSSDIPTSIAQGARVSMQVKQVVINQDSVCVVGFDDVGYCIGQNYTGQLGNGNTTNSSTFVSVLQGDMPSQRIKKFALGTYNEHNCAIGFDDRAYCWGSNYSGEVGNGTTYGSNTVPKAVSAGKMSNRSVKSIAVNKSVSCAVNFDNLAFCWGNNITGGIGDGTMINKTTPVGVYVENNRTKFSDVFAGGNSSNACALSTTGDVYCWGYNEDGNLGLGYTDYANVPNLINQGFMPFQSAKKITLGYDHSCVIASNDSVYCWGLNESGQLGINNNSLGAEYKPSQVVKGSMSGITAKQISSSNNSSCLIGYDDKAYCWGYNYYGQLGDGSTTFSQKPVAVAQGAMPSNIVKQITVGSGHACAIASDDAAYCWGSNYSGRLGNGTTTQSKIPVAVLQGDRPSMSVKSISAYDDSTCVIASDDNVYCWGSGSYGKLGNGGTASSYVPVAVLQGARPSVYAKSIELGMGHACTIALNDNAYCWGLNSNGQLGDGSVNSSSLPVAVLQGVMQSKSVKKISLGRMNSCAISMDNKLFCWGYASSGQLSKSANTSAQKSPVSIFTGNLSNALVSQVSVGNRHICAIASDSRIYCWGQNNYGQLGESAHSVFSHNTPQFVKHP